MEVQDECLTEDSYRLFYHGSSVVVLNTLCLIKQMDNYFVKVGSLDMYCLKSYSLLKIKVGIDGSMKNL